MRRFFAEGLKETDKDFELAGQEFKHLRDVLRLEPGDAVVLFDGKGLEAEGAIKSIGKAAALIDVTKINNVVRPDRISITLLQALTKGDVPEFVVEKATELGAARVVFFAARRSVITLDEENKKKKLEKFRKTTIAAAKQCERTRLVDIEIKSFEEALKEAAELKVLFYEDSTDMVLKNVLRERSYKSLSLLIGPEGGFEKEEVEAAKAAGFKVISLGTRVLRADTASVAALSIVQYELGDMGQAT
ncbi:MAG: 16S rRNA (uracil(1498)-N(3))-methyltransferase [Deltaproteobacteria bacterium]|nr:16S rRNA (uracil(1498)-N(3))-methyltransferase [Deltaproteobacteria bacterium]